MAIRIGTRSSPLALKQTELFIEALIASNFATRAECEVIPITTTGDMIQDRPLYDIGGKALFAKELQAAMLQDEIDCAVHSLKDMESVLPPTLEIGAVLPRESPWDVWISRDKLPLEEMAPGAVVGSCSPRRAAQLLKLRPDLQIKPIRGNIGRRLQQLEEGVYEGTILADAGLRRLGLREKMTERLPLNLMVPAAGQGIIAIECRQTDLKMRGLLAKINHAESFHRMTAERALLKALGGACRTPIAAFASLLDDGKIRLTGVLANEAGTKMARYEAVGCDPIQLGQEVAMMLKKQLMKN